MTSVRGDFSASSQGVMIVRRLFLTARITALPASAHKAPDSSNRWRGRLRLNTPSLLKLTFHHIFDNQYIGHPFFQRPCQRWSATTEPTGNRQGTDGIATP